MYSFFAFIVGMIFLTASDGQAQNSTFVNQQGEGHSVTVSQQGNGNSISIKQSGGQRNQAVIQQSAESNSQPIADNPSERLPANKVNLHVEPGTETTISQKGPGANQIEINQRGPSSVVVDQSSGTGQNSFHVQTISGRQKKRKH